MSIEKMNLISIIGPLNEFDRIIYQYLIGNNIHLENMFTVVKNSEGLESFPTSNPFEEILKTITETVNYANIDIMQMSKIKHNMQYDDILNYSKAINLMFSSLCEKRKQYEQQIHENLDILNQIENFENVDFPLDHILNFKYIKVRFGRLPRDSYTQLETYIKDYSIFFFKHHENKDYIYGSYFAPYIMHEKIDTLFSSLHFERVYVSEKVSGTPRKVIKDLNTKNEFLKQKIDNISKEISTITKKEYEKICIAYNSTLCLYKTYEIRKYSSHTKSSFNVAGWVCESDLPILEESLDAEQHVTLIEKKPEAVPHVTPPTKLKNLAIFRPFQSYVEMYGLPSYNEIDPTWIFALTYSFMFGAMYGDVGHGFVLAIIGFLLAKKKLFLGPILETCGAISIIFGFLYGSVFGYEHIIKTFWYKPMHNSETIMQTLILAVVLGTIILSIAMILNITNGIKQKNIERILFDANGVAGFVFYWGIMIGIVSMLLGNSIMTIWYVSIFVIFPLILVFFKHPLGKLLQKRKDWMPKNKLDFIVDNFFEMFEILLSYVTNTISFIRVGAFALNHAGMLTVVFSLAQMTKGASSIIVIIFGNILVLGLEALLVSIQILRLQYYEMFSRYYGGEGKAFESKYTKIN